MLESLLYDLTLTFYLQFKKRSLFLKNVHGVSSMTILFSRYSFSVFQRFISVFLIFPPCKRVCRISCYYFSVFQSFCLYVFLGYRPSATFFSSFYLCISEFLFKRFPGVSSFCDTFQQFYFSVFQRFTSVFWLAPRSRV